MAASNRAGFGETEYPGFNQDMAVGDRYIAFSAELLRLALLALGGIGYLFKAGSFSAVHGILLSAGLLMAMCGLFALAHRYITCDIHSCQLRFLRLCGRGLASDEETAKREASARRLRLSLAGPLLLLAATLLVVGAAVFIIACYKA